MKQSFYSIINICRLTIILTLLLAMLSLTSCTNAEASDKPLTETTMHNQVHYNSVQGDMLWACVRAEQMEKNANPIMTYVYLTFNEFYTLHDRDIIWVNLDTHRQDDLDNNAMACKLDYSRIVMLQPKTN